MKKIMFLVFMVCSISILIGGKMYWNHKIENVASAKTEVKTEEKETVPEVNVSYMAHTKNLTEDVVAKVKAVATTKKPVSMMFVESTNNSWSLGAKKGIEEAYGEGVWDINNKSYDSQTSQMMIGGKFVSEVVSEKPDVILFEVPVLNDNGQVTSDVSAQNINALLTAIKKQLPSVSIILQPSRPVYNANYYPKEIKAFKEYSDSMKYTYVDLWVNFPDYKSKDILKYMTTDKLNLNEAGNALWSDAIINYFVAR